MAKRNPLGMNFKVDAKDIKALSSSLDAKARREFENQVRRVTEESTSQMLSEVTKNAKSRSGLRYVTGAYVASWRANFTKMSDGSYSGDVRSAHPAAWRLEYGFTGRDSLGRYYNQRPFPHFRPAYDKVQQQFFDRLDLLIDSWADSE